MSSPQHALPLLIVGAIFIAFSPIFVRLSELGPLATAFYRIALALPLLWLWARSDAQTKTRAPLRRRDWLYLGLAGLLFALDLMAWHFSILFTSVANATLLGNFAPVFVTLGSWLLFKERFTYRFWLALALGISGAAVMMGDSLRFDPKHLLGDALGLLTALFYGSYILTVSRLRRHFSTALIMSITALVSSAILLPVASSVETTLLATSLQGWLILLALAWLSHALGQGLITFSLAHLPAAFSSLTLLLQPVIAALLAWWLLDEALRPQQSVGALLVLGAIVLARRNGAGQHSQQARAKADS